MAKCKNDVLLNMITQKQLTRNAVATFNVIDELPDCKKIMANAYIDIVGGQGFNTHKKPTERFECDAYGCLSGTQYIAPEGDGEEATNASLTYRAMFDATEFANGVITFYVAPTEATEGNITVTIGDNSDFADADVYKVAYTESDITDDGYIPVMIDLSAVPAEVKGEGWTASANGAYIKIESDVAVGVSSLSIFDDVNDFAINDVVQIACLSGFEGTDDLDYLESECLSGGYDTSSDTPIERTLTGRMLTPNYQKLNPRAGKGDKTEAFVQSTITATPELDGDYAKVVLADKAENCGWLAAQISDACNVTESQLELLSVPKLVAMDSDKFIALTEDGVTTLYFDKDLAGQEVLITYPRRAAVQNHMVYSMDNVGSRRVRMTIELPTSDGVTNVFVANDVLITSFPLTITNEETEFAFTIAIQRDANGVNYERYDVIG